MSNLQFGKVVEARLTGCTNIYSDTRLTLGDSTSAVPNPLRGTLFWDRCMYVLTGVSVGGGATGGSFTLTVQTDAIAGYTGLPIAAATVGPLTSKTGVVIMDNLHQSAGSPVPTHINIDQTVANAGTTQGIHFQLYCIAKQYRGVLGTAGAKTAERILQGSLTAPSTYTTDTTLVLGITDTDIGMGRMRLWDSAMFWAIGNSAVSGTWDVDIVGKVGGKTVSIASTGTAGTITAEGDRKALVNNFYGQCPNPTNIIVTEVSAGTITDLDIIGIAKSGRGSMGKR